MEQVQAPVHKRVCSCVFFLTYIYILHDYKQGGVGWLWGGGLCFNMPCYSTLRIRSSTFPVLIVTSETVWHILLLADHLRMSAVTAAVMGWCCVVSPGSGEQRSDWLTTAHTYHGLAESEQNRTWAHAGNNVWSAQCTDVFRKWRAFPKRNIAPPPINH
jgi:hypothetical protein